MNRQEFMRRLEQLLEGIPEEEKREAIAYYTSYFEDAGEENEEKIIRELESPEKVAATIRADFPGCNSSETASSDGQQSYNGAASNTGQQNYNGVNQNPGQQNNCPEGRQYYKKHFADYSVSDYFTNLGKYFSGNWWNFIGNYRRTIWNCSRLCNRRNSGSRCSNYNSGNRHNFPRSYFYGSRTSDACNRIMRSRTSGFGMWKVSPMVGKRNCKLMAVII